MALTLVQLNSATPAQFIQWLDGAYEHSPWIAERAAGARPFQSLAQLKLCLVQIVRDASFEEQSQLILAHPELAGQAMEAIALTRASTHEQSKAGLTACTPAELRQLKALNADYIARFGFPFVLAVLGPRGSGLSKEQIIVALERRLANHPDFERAEALRNIHRIAELRLNDKFDAHPVQGNVVWDWAETLAEHTDTGYQDTGQLTVTYLTDAHRACAQRLTEWMREDCGFDSVETDAVGNVVGIYHGDDPQARRLLTGSHYDTVRNGGKYDGRLGIFVPMACVQALHRQGRRLPFGIEVVGFAEEEGQRFKATFLGSGALTGHFDPSWLEQTDADGVSMREAMEHAGLDIDDIPNIKRDPTRYLGFVELHIEQGPVLNEMGLPLGVVTSINGGTRFVGQITGMASHAGTTPMNSRRDAAAAAAEFLLSVESRGKAVPDLVATVGMLEVPNGSINVIPGACRFSLDIRATSDAVRDACVDDAKTSLQEICQRRGVDFVLQESMRAAAAPCAPEWQNHWQKAIEGMGLPVFRMPSGAGHDAMKLHEVMPQAMLFVRGENAGISHNPLESSTSDDMQLAVEAFGSLLKRLSG